MKTKLKIEVAKMAVVVNFCYSLVTVTKAGYVSVLMRKSNDVSNIPCFSRSFDVIVILLENFITRTSNRCKTLRKKTPMFIFNYIPSGISGHPKSFPQIS